MGVLSGAELDRELAAIETAHVERLRGVLDPYELLSRLDHERRDSDRANCVRWAMRFYTDFVSRAARYPRADQDALVHMAKRVFLVTIPTIRADIAKAQRERSAAT